ncbi:BgTH12-06956 [Blumeria graminis f. sp. triticale]|uniref:Transcription initiation factor TFIID subunit 4 n=1 Tax=Blumeria graminis f. sp. triticale TaxID=1689686 RepID=A0A9W4DQB3_BLUGR|nr:BgTH12-06956 [Blumeria graminis f. sp. triticale]
MAQQQQPYLAPPQGSGSPSLSDASSVTQPLFSSFANKRPRLSPNNSQPSSPYASQSPYSHPPPAQSTHSPHFANVSIPPQAYTTPYSNGHNNPSINISQVHTNNQNGHQHSSAHPTNKNSFLQQPSFNSNYTMGSGTMGPPSKPVEKPKEESIDVMDVLGGTGVNLREEEQYTFQLYNESFNSMVTGSHSGTISSSYSFTQFPPSDEASFYGAGPANAIGEIDTKSQDEYIQKAADKAWRDAARNLHVSRQRELDNPFLHVHLVHAKLRKMASEHGIELNTDNKGMMGIMTRPHAFSERDMKVQTAVGPDGILVTTNGNFLPYDSMLVDQLALLSIATKYRLQGLVEDAIKLARGRRTGAHGSIPQEWTDIVVPYNYEGSTNASEDGVRFGWESAVSPYPNPLKRSLSNAERSLTSGKITNEVILALRRQALKEREAEETRLRKRLARTTGVNPISRQASVAPGTPGSVAPEAIDKVPTKKEQKKKVEAKVNEAASHAAANVTTAQFLGGGGGLFGKKKKYSWMNPAPGGGSSSSKRIGAQGSPNTGGISNAPVERLTVDGARRLGTWREDREKGAGVQLRDWITVLEQDGHEKKALQIAYMNLDNSDPK